MTGDGFITNNAESVIESRPDRRPTAARDGAKQSWERANAIPQLSQQARSMAQIKSSARPINAGHLKWTAVTPRLARRLDQEQAPSPCERAPRFLNDLPAIEENYEPKQPITKKLQRLIHAYSYAEAFEQAIASVCQQQIPELDQIHNLNQFYYFVDAMVTWIPELRSWQWIDGIYHERTDYLRITQFYYYFSQPSLIALQSAIQPVTGAFLAPLSLWLREYAIEYGKFLDTPESIKYLQSYGYGPEYALDNNQYVDTGMSGYKSFNAWFSRTFKAIDQQRPVAEPDNQRIITFPAESTVVGQWAIRGDVNAGGRETSAVVVKHIEWPIAALLSGSAYAEDFAGGTLVQCFLNVNDYHRQHAPAAGKILEARFIPGQVFMEVELETAAPEQDTATSSSAGEWPEAQLEARDRLGFQFLQCRGLFVLQTAVGKIAVLPVGMAQVSSVVFVQPGSEELIRLSEAEQQQLSYDEQVRLINARIQTEVVGRTVNKGDMMTSFLFGGSDCLMLFERQANIHLTASVGAHYPVRSQMAYSARERLLA
ncbi:MAG: phosphatidylserine decarboxylase [Cyanobacteriota bacterium]|nr:phosphatidylserine decarboxylase [Cyanobacteriota bacterium]